MAAGALMASGWSRSRSSRHSRAAIPEWAPRPISEQAIEVVAIIAMKQPVSISEINEIRGIGAN